VSKADGENFDPLDFDLPDDEITESEEELEPLDESTLSEESGLDGPLGDLEESEVTDDEAEETVPKPGKKKKKKDKKPRAKKQKKEKKPKAKKAKQGAEEGMSLATIAVWAVCGISCLGLLVADAMIFSSRGGSPSTIVFIVFLSVFWLIATAIPFMLWKGRQTNTAYVVFLGISLAGILIANLLLLLELASYGGDIGAKGAQARIHVAPAVQSAADNASATA
jgi:cation transport ATPase